MSLWFLSQEALSNLSIQKVVQNVLQLTYQVVCFLFKFMLIPIAYPVSWLVSLFELFLNIGRVFFGYLVYGVRKTQKKLKIGPFESRIYYAILKGNGQYLKLEKQSIEDIFTCQLYDYSIRKFMTVSKIGKDLRIAQIQFWSTTGLSYIKDNFQMANVMGLSNSVQKVSKLKGKKGNLDLSYTDYLDHSQRNAYDILIFFNRGELFNEGESSIDIIKILGYIKKNLSSCGYAVVGNGFANEDELKVFEEMIESFGLRIEMKEDITSNIVHSRKILNRIHKNRKIAWTFGKVKDYLKKVFSLQNTFTQFLNSCWAGVQEVLGVKHQDCLYQVYILEQAK